MSLFSPKIEVTPAMLAMRLGDLYYPLSRGLEKSLESMNRFGVGESVYQAIKNHTDCLVAFSMEFAVRTLLKEDEAATVLETVFFPVSSADIEAYRQSFQNVPESSTWRRAGTEYLLAGLAFQESCGSTGIREADDLIRQFGAQTFAKIFDVVKKEIKSVRLRRA
jgi:hypothetical protein